MTFTEAQQRDHRKAFITGCRQKAWGALCHAEWISKNLDDLLTLYQKFQTEDQTLADQIKEAETAIDYHTVENRTKRKTMQERRNKLAQDMKALGENMQRGQQSLAQSVETNLSLATLCRNVELEGGRIFLALSGGDNITEHAVGALKEIVHRLHHMLDVFKVNRLIRQ
jgi:hypothetical protein